MNRIQELRKARNIKQLELCAILNIAQPTLSGWESGKRQVDYINLKKLSEIFNVSIDYILGYSDNPNPPKTNEPITQPLPYSPRVLAIAEKIEKLSPEMRASIEAQLKLFQSLQQEIDKNK